MDLRRFRYHFLAGSLDLPIDVMPVWLQKISVLIPITYSLDALRLTILQGAAIGSIAKPVLMLLAMAVVLLPASLEIFAAAVHKGRKEGTLMLY